MIRLIMIPVVMAAGALLMFWIDNRLPVWERDREMNRLIRHNRRYERMIEETPRKRMNEQYAVYVRRG